MSCQNASGNSSNDIAKDLKNLSKIEYDLEYTDTSYFSPNFQKAITDELVLIKERIENLRAEQKAIQSSCQHVWTYGRTWHGNKSWYTCDKCDTRDWQ